MSYGGASSVSRSEVERLRTESRAVQFLVTGAFHWHDGDAVRSMFHLAFGRYGGPSRATLLTFDGNWARARRCTGTACTKIGYAVPRGGRILVIAEQVTLTTRRAKGG